MATCYGSEVTVIGTPPRRNAYAAEILDAPLPRVDIVGAYVGADGAFIRAAVDAGARGLVIAALGAGNVPPPMAEAISTVIADGVPVVITSRTGAGPVIAQYGGPGGGAELVRAGAVLGGALRPAQARLLLAVELASHSDDVSTPSVPMIAEAVTRFG